MPHEPPEILAHRGVSRLAPSPTGALHLGNARTFLINWAMARRHGWRLVLRIEDFDTPRVKAGAAESAMDTIRWLGIDWDPWPSPTGACDHLVQSGSLEPYRAAMRLLAARGLAYPCELTRTQIEAAASAPQEGVHDIAFPATLRPPAAGSAFDFDALDAAADPAQRPNWRFITQNGPVRFDDRVRGEQMINPSEIIGDFVLWTRRGQPSYQLAVVVDDHRQGVTEVVRGDDLLDSAARQLLLYRALGLGPEPTYTHLPLVLGSDGRRLAKRHGDTRLDHFREIGVPAGAVIGLVARWSLAGCEPRRVMTAAEFCDRFDLTTMPKEPVVLLEEDVRWLESMAG